MPLRPPAKTPCAKCPFKRSAVPGYLGDSTPEQFMDQTYADNAMPCHLTLDYERPDWREQPGRLCAGALIFFANQQKAQSQSRAPATAS